MRAAIGRTMTQCSRGSLLPTQTSKCWCVGGQAAAALAEVERVGVGQEEEEGELEKSASVASRRGIGREIVLNGDTFLLIW